jgi:hypothetical protein
MRWLMRMALLAQLFSSSSSSPLSFYKGHQDHSTVSKRDEEFTVENLSNEFKGIYWNHIFSEKDDCTVEQRNQIIYATRATMWLLEPLVDDMEYAYSTAWTRYFGDYNNWQGRGKEIEKVASTIQCQYGHHTNLTSTDNHHSQYHANRKISQAGPPEEDIAGVETALHVRPHEPGLCRGKMCTWRNVRVQNLWNWLPNSMLRRTDCFSALRSPSRGKEANVSLFSIGLERKNLILSNSRWRLAYRLLPAFLHIQEVGVSPKTS